MALIRVAVLALSLAGGHARAAQNAPSRGNPLPAAGSAPIPLLPSGGLAPIGGGFDVRSPLVQEQPFVSQPQATPGLSLDAHTGLYGVDVQQRAAIVSVLKESYGDALIDAAAVGSRVLGKASALKSHRPVNAHSDLDLVPLIKAEAGGKTPSSFDIARRLKELLGFGVEVHTVLSFDGARFGDAVPFYGGGGEHYHLFDAGEAVRIPLDEPGR